MGQGRVLPVRPPACPPGPLSFIIQRKVAVLRPKLPGLQRTHAGRPRSQPKPGVHREKGLEDPWRGITANAETAWLPAG